MEDHKKVLSTQILIEVEVEVVKLHFEVDTEARMVNIIKEGQVHGGGQGNFGGKGSRGRNGGRGGNHRGQQPNSDSNCYYCKKPGHMAKDLLSKGA